MQPRQFPLAAPSGVVLEASRPLVLVLMPVLVREPSTGRNLSTIPSPLKETVLYHASQLLLPAYLLLRLQLLAARCLPRRPRVRSRRSRGTSGSNPACVLGQLAPNP